MSEQYTPSTAEIRLAHAESVTMHKMMEPWLTAANKMFDRWLAQVVAAAEQYGKEQAWDEGYWEGEKDGMTLGHPLGNMRDPTENPYRTDQMEGDE